MIDHTTQFPHCDARVLHAPGECEFCDRHPDWQDLRKIWMVAFTGHEPETSEHAGAQVPCPADYNRPPDTASDHRRWGGNVATTQQPANETAASRMFYGPTAYATVGFVSSGNTVGPGVAFEFEEVPVEQATAGAPPKVRPIWLRIRRRR